MLRNTIQHYYYNRQQQKNELINLLKLLRIPVYTLVFFNVIEVLKKIFFSEYEFFLSFFFWAFCILLIAYWMPNKKEFKAWKKTHATF